MPSPDILDLIPEHVADPVPRASWRRRVLTAGGDGLLSLLLNGAVLGGMFVAGWPLRDLAAPTPVSVELVDHVPGQDSAVSEKRAGPRGKGEEPEAAAPAAAAPASAQGRPDAPMQKGAPEPTPPPPPVPAANPAEAATPPAPTDVPKPEATAESSPTPVQAAPPPPEHPDADAAPRLVEAPMAPPAATAPHSETGPPEASPPPATDVGPAATDTPAAQPAIAAPADAEAVPPPSPPPAAPKPLTAEQRRQAENTAKLAAMLPFGADIRGTPFGTPQPDQDQPASTAYRGQVYANFNKAQDVIADAKARHLKGQAVIAFTIDDGGGIASIGVAVSSRDPAVDQAALELIRRAAPFPPPPPGAQRSFSPAIGLGLDE